MRTVLIGSDFVYDKNGVLKPIEINTNIAHNLNIVENQNEILDLTTLQSFIGQNNFTKLSYLGADNLINEGFKTLCENLSITYEFYKIQPDSITIPFIEDTTEHLIIRSAYDTTALVDDTYCRDKVNFLNLIKNQSFGAQFAYIDETNQLVNNITSITDNGNHPNFILKARLPNYDKSLYPKFFKISSTEELNSVLNTLTSDYFLMEFYFNENKLHNNFVTKFRSLNILFPPNLENINIGQYTDLTSQYLPSNPTYNNTTFELDGIYRNAYTTEDLTHIILPKLSDDDLVEMADGTFKVATDLVVGDSVKTILIPNSDNIDLALEAADYHISLSDFISGSTYTTNTITKIKRVNSKVDIVKISFTDNTDWFDTENSYYLVETNSDIKFVELKDLKSGDNIILIDTTNTTNVSTIVKTVSNVTQSSEIFTGFIITVSEKHLFLTKPNGNDNTSFVAIEHNNRYCSNAGSCTQWSCPKGSVCTGFSQCWPYPRYCN
jgi:hypothetical protein